MNTTLWLLLGAAALLLVYGALAYNRLVELKHNVAKSWSNIEVLLKQRHDELPKLVETCRRYMAHEQGTLEKVMLARGRVAGARERGDVEALGAAEGELRQGLGRLFAVAEDYPELRADQTFLHLQSRITGLENAIADRREFYNETVNLNNVRLEQFPELLIGRCFGFRPRKLLKFREEEIRDPDLNRLFG